MLDIKIEHLTEKQREAWLMRYVYGWRMSRIALKLGTRTAAVSRLLRRAQMRAGLPRRRAVPLARNQPRLASVQSLTGVFDY